MNGPRVTCCACGEVTDTPGKPFCDACSGNALPGIDAVVTPKMIDAAYRALTPTTPDPIRELVLELAGRIA